VILLAPEKLRAATTPLGQAAFRVGRFRLLSGPSPRKRRLKIFPSSSDVVIGSEIYDRNNTLGEFNMTDRELLAEWQTRAAYIYDTLFAVKSIDALSHEQKACVGMLADIMATQLPIAQNDE